jgi:hypothetical protein
VNAELDAFKGVLDRWREHVLGAWKGSRRRICGGLFPS